MVFFCVYGDDSVNRRTAAAFRNLLPAFQVFTEFIHRLSLIRQHMESALEQKSSYTVKRFFCRKALTGLLWQFMSITASSMACPDVKPERAGRLPLSLKSSPAEIWPLHMPLKLFSIGYRLLDGTGESDFKEFAEKNPATIQNLAYGEHLRWSASFYVRGWRVGDELSLPSGKTKDLYEASVMPVSFPGRNCLLSANNTTSTINASMSISSEIWNALQTLPDTVSQNSDTFLGGGIFMTEKKVLQLLCIYQL